MCFSSRRERRKAQRIDYLAHVVRVFMVGIVFGLYVVHLVSQCLLVQVKRCAVALTDVQGHVFGIEHLYPTQSKNSATGCIEFFQLEDT